MVDYDSGQQTSFLGLMTLSKWHMLVDLTFTLKKGFSMSKSGSGTFPTEIWLPVGCNKKLGPRFESTFAFLKHYRL